MCCSTSNCCGERQLAVAILAQFSPKYWSGFRVSHKCKDGRSVHARSKHERFLKTRNKWWYFFALISLFHLAGCVKLLPSWGEQKYCKGRLINHRVAATMNGTAETSYGLPKMSWPWFGHPWSTLLMRFFSYIWLEKWVIRSGKDLRFAIIIWKMLIRSLTERLLKARWQNSELQASRPTRP